MTGSGYGRVAFSSDTTIDGNLIVDGEGGYADFHTVPQLTGTLILDTGSSSYGGLANFFVDATLPIVMRAGSLLTEPGVTFTPEGSVLRAHGGYVDAHLENTEEILKTRSGELALRNIGPSDAEIIIREGTVFSQLATGLGTPVGGVVVDAPKDAVLVLEGDGIVYDEPIQLNNATGYDRLGGLILGRGNDLPLTLAGPLDLGNVGSIIGTRGPARIRGTITGGDLTVVGDDELILLGDAAQYSGQTIIGQVNGFSAGGLALEEDGRLAATSRITVYRNASLRMDKRNWVGITDQVADTIPIDLRGGSLRLEGGITAGSVPTETLGEVGIRRGASEIAITCRWEHESPTVLTLQQLIRDPAGVLQFGSPPNRPLGGSQSNDSRIYITQPPTLSNGILGGWAIVYTPEESRFDFATYDTDGGRGIHTLSLDGRPSDLGQADQGSNVLLTDFSPTTPLAASTTINSLVTHGVNSIDLGGHELNIVSGGFIASRPVVVSNGALTAGGGGGHAELTIHNQWSDTTIEADIVDNPIGTVSLVKSGSSTLFLTGENSYGGTTTVLEGFLEVQAESALPPSTDIVVDGGSFYNWMGNCAARGARCHSRWRRCGR